KSPQIVFDDADLQLAADGVISGIFAAAGQTCMAGSRLLVQNRIAQPLLQAVLERVARIRLGDPQDPGTQMGPIATPPQYEKILALIEAARAEGATVAAGGGPAALGGYFVQP